MAAYLAGMSARDVGEVHGVRASTVTAWVTRAGGRVRGRQDSAPITAEQAHEAMERWGSVATVAEIYGVAIGTVRRRLGR